MKLLILTILFCSQAFAGSLLIEYPQRERRASSKLEIRCDKICQSGTREVDSEFFKDKIGQIIQIQAKGDLPKSFPDKHIKKITVIDGKHIVIFFMGSPKEYSGAEMNKFTEFNDIISEVEFMVRQGKEK